MDKFPTSDVGDFEEMRVFWVHDVMICVVSVAFKTAPF